jgi:hypothetical protein
MPAQHLPAEQLLRRKPNATCCDCGKEAADAKETEVWTIWNDIHIYCPKCARNENVGPDD